jgi:hypothetical protein
MVDPFISVSEGHYIAEAARAAVLKSHHVMDVMVHIDPEDDVQSKPNAHTPQRHLLLVHLHKRLALDLPADTRILLHYLNGKIEAELLLPSAADAGELQAKCNAIVADDPYFKRIDVYRDVAPK